MTKQEYKSEAYYQSITGIEFRPVEIIDYIKPKYRKGQITQNKAFFGLMKEKRAETDLYDCYCELVSKEKYASSRGLAINENGDFVRMACVKIFFAKTNDYYKFMTDEEAISFLNDIKNKCAACGNKLM